MFPHIFWCLCCRHGKRPSGSHARRLFSFEPLKFVAVCIGSFTSMSAHPNPPALFPLFSAFGCELRIGVNGLPHWGIDSLPRWMFPHISWCLCYRHGKPHAIARHLAEVGQLSVAVCQCSGRCQCAKKAPKFQWKQPSEMAPVLEAHGTEAGWWWSSFSM